MYGARRRELAKRMKEGVAVFLAPPDGSHYLTSGDLLYLTGMNEPHFALVLVAGRQPKVHLFLRPYDRVDEIWNGRRATVEDGAKPFGVDEVHDIKQLETKLVSWLSGQKTFWAPLGGGYDQADQIVLGVMKKFRATKRGAASHLPVVRDPGLVLHPLRLVKAPEELIYMKKAAEITTLAYEPVFKAMRPGLIEGEISGLLDYGFRQRGGEGPAYPSIVGSGENGCFLHYSKNSKVMKDGELVVIDAGARCQYACDVSRTLPVNGRFTEAQARVYDIVLEAEEVSIRRSRPGVSLAQVYQAAVEVLVRGMIRLGCVKERTVKAVLKKKSHQAYFPHGVGHWLGLGVHDVGPYTMSNGKSVILRPGMVYTVEPGLYFPVNDRLVPKAYRGIGIRIEDDVLITSRGHEVLTKGIPKTRNDIEAAMFKGGEK